MRFPGESGKSGKALGILQGAGGGWVLERGHRSVAPGSFSALAAKVCTHTGSSTAALSLRPGETDPQWSRNPEGHTASPGQLQTACLQPLTGISLLFLQRTLLPLPTLNPRHSEAHLLRACPPSGLGIFPTRQRGPAGSAEATPPPTLGPWVSSLPWEPPLFSAPKP
uniref:Uncharacterized protein n=1 Tax=Pipistrellus kuhlii TaxID=59472 RepID=A0A7J7R0G5_PIPKU|nr:hypothetical protein mPipKuh1_008111 [Pipistrellus kuhlii]